MTRGSRKVGEAGRVKARLQSRELPHVAVRFGVPLYRVKEIVEQVGNKREAVEAALSQERTGRPTAKQSDAAVPTAVGHKNSSS